MNPIKEFEKAKKEYIQKMIGDSSLLRTSRRWFVESCRYNYSYNFSWMGRPIIQFPQDIMAMQEIIWEVKPELIIETGIAHGGSLIFYASMQSLIGKKGHVLGIDIDIREHNRVEIEAHPLFNHITMIEGSSTDENIVNSVHEFAAGKRSVLVVLDSNHTHAHVLKELELYSGLVTKDSYLVVFDTVIEDMPDDFFTDRPWGKGDNPKTAVHEFLAGNDRFAIDHGLVDKLLITVAPDGYLKCVRD
ncbi:cephalosporin hydroxylase family protein [Thermodesulfobacteriota bacterium]